MNRTTLTILAVFALFCQTVMAQVYILPGANNAPIQRLENALAVQINEHVAIVQNEEAVRVPDSVVLTVVTNAEGKASGILIDNALSARHAAALIDFIKTNLNFEASTSLTLAVVYPPLTLWACPVEHLTGVPETEICNSYDSKNESFRLACFRYLNEENLKHVTGPDSLTLKELEGWVKATVQIDVDGKVEQVQFDDASFNPGLNDVVVAQLANLRFLDGGYYDKKQVSYSLDYFESFQYAVVGNELQYLNQSEAYYKAKAYYPCAYTMIKAKGLGYKLTKQDVNLLASAYLLAGDSSLAFQWWRTNFKEDELKGMKMVPQKVGDVYTATLVEYTTPAPDPNGAVGFALVEKKPVYPGCESIKDQEEQFNCFNKGIMGHIGKTFKFPIEARQRGIQGKMYVTFVIEKNGEVGNVAIARGVHPLLDLEAMRVICTLPKMEPAYQREKIVRMQYTVPINAKLQ